MKLISRILVATDFLEHSGNVLDNAIGLGKTFDTEITLIHVLPDNIPDEKAMRLLREAATRRLAEAKTEIDSQGVQTAEPILVSGIHFEKIVEAADRIDANIIVIGAGEKRENEAFRLGTTAEKVVRLSDRPVLVVKPNQPFRVETILCPVDFSRASARALKGAVIAARRFEARLLILSVIEENFSVAGTFTHDWDAFSGYWAKQWERLKIEHLQQFDAFLKGFNLEDVPFEKMIAEGRAATEILSAISKYKVDLLFMGTTGRTGLSRMMMGSVTEKVIRTVPCTFMATKKGELIRLELETKISDIEKHYGNAIQLVKDGFYEEAVGEFENCLMINDMHVPSLKGLARTYEKMKRPETAAKYKKMARDVLDRIWNLKIETEIRGTYGH